MVQSLPGGTRHGPPQAEAGPAQGLTSHHPVLHLHPDFIIRLKLRIDPLHGKEEKVLTKGQGRVPVHSPLPEPSGSAV